MKTFFKAWSLFFILPLLFPACEAPEASMSEEEILALVDETGGQNPKFGPKGNWILYTTNDGTKRSIRKMRRTNLEIQQLFETENYICCVNFSKDGRYISFNLGNPDLDIWRMDADGTNLIALTENDLHDGGPSWTYDNSRLVFTSVHEGKFELAGIYTIKPDGTDKKRLHALDFRAFDPAWSHSNRYVLAQHIVDQNMEIYRIDVEMGGTLQMTVSDSADWYPSWSPDDQTIAYRNNESGNWDLFLMDADGQNKRKITDSTTEDRAPTFSPDGQYIAYQSRQTAEEDFDIWLIQADGTNRRNLTADQFDNQSPNWSPDGEVLTYSAKVGEQWHVMKINRNGTGKAVLTRKREAN